MFLACPRSRGQTEVNVFSTRRCGRPERWSVPAKGENRTFCIFFFFAPIRHLICYQYVVRPRRHNSRLCRPSGHSQRPGRVPAWDVPYWMARHCNLTFPLGPGIIPPLRPPPSPLFPRTSANVTACAESAAPYLFSTFWEADVCEPTQAVISLSLTVIPFANFAHFLALFLPVALSVFRAHSCARAHTNWN